MKRIFHPWHLWEDHNFNFYGGTSKIDEESIIKCKEMFQDIPLFELALETVINEWKFSCEHNLSNESLNKIAYLGQASCSLLFKVPSRIGSSGYNLLSGEEKNKADASAQKFLEIWIENQRQKLSA